MSYGGVDPLLNEQKALIDHYADAGSRIEAHYVSSFLPPLHNPHPSDSVCFSGQSLQTLLLLDSVRCPERLRRCGLSRYKVAPGIVHLSRQKNFLPPVTPSIQRKVPLLSKLSSSRLSGTLNKSLLEAYKSSHALCTRGTTLIPLYEPEKTWAHTPMTLRAFQHFNLEHLAVRRAD